MVTGIKERYSHLQLADAPAPVKLLLGADVFPVFTVVYRKTKFNQLKFSLRLQYGIRMNTVGVGSAFSVTD